MSAGLLEKLQRTDKTALVREAGKADCCSATLNDQTMLDAAPSDLFGFGRSLSEATINEFVQFGAKTAGAPFFCSLE